MQHMKRKRFCCFGSGPFFLAASIIFFMSQLTQQAYSQHITVGSFNVRLQTDRDTGNLWINRAPMVVGLLRFHGFDLFGTQEGFRNQLDDIKKGLPGFEYYGAGRDDGKQKGEHSAIFYRKDRFKLLKSGDFWLSETPDQPSMGWDGKCCHRVCTWVQLQDQKTGKKFYFFNAHFDHQGIVARKESSKLILERIRAIAGTEPVIFSGDLNGNRESEWYRTISSSGFLTDTHTIADFRYEGNGSFNSFGANLRHS